MLAPKLLIVYDSARCLNVDQQMDFSVAAYATIKISKVIK